ncbi:hypothetical protein [Jiangella gansuensis]|uniref:hypothetical protein n=1 Tax=Jiangella gansuensis TaxID=281473 RepID=UPI00047D9FE2|nr:hypothetical protein [Jiangella gansuensis]
MSADDDPDVASAARRLRAVRAGLSADAEPVDDSIKTAIDAIVELIERPTTPELRQVLHETAHEIRLLGTQMTAIREDATDAIGHAMATEASQIEALLRPPDGDTAPLAPPHATGPGEPADLAEPPAPLPDLVSTAHDADAIARRLPDAASKRRAINQVVARFPPKLQALARTLLFGQSSHAVQRHGHHLRREHQLARVQWRLDPAGDDDWQLNPDGSTESHRWNGQAHQVGTTCGHYTSPDAVAKPLIAVFNAAGRTQAELDAYLDAKAEGETFVGLFLRPETASIRSEDVYSLRAPGTDTDPGMRMWLDSRASANKGHGEAPAVREYDIVSRGQRPGSLVMFAKRPDQSWRLITSYFLDDSGHQFEYVEM